MVTYSYVRAIGTDPGLANEELPGAANTTDPENQAADKAAKIKYL